MSNTDDPRRICDRFRSGRLGLRRKPAPTGWQHHWLQPGSSVDDEQVAELLKEITPGLKRVSMIFNPDTAPYIGTFYLPSLETAAQSLGVTVELAPVHSDAEIETVITALGREPGGGLLAMPDNFIDAHRASIVALAARNNVPAVYQTPSSARDSGLLSYGADFRDIFRRAARYVDSILRGAKPSDLPVQMPTKYVMIVNLKTAKALGLTVPQSVFPAADEVIE